MKRARWVFVVAGVVMVVVIIAGIAAAQLGDVAGPERVDIAPGISGISTGKSYAYILDGTSGVVLVDTGSDRGMHAVLEELARRGKSAADIKAVVLTSAHPFTQAGLDALPDVPVYVGADDEDATRQPRLVKAPLAQLLGRLGSHKRHGNPLIAVPAGALLDVDGVQLEAIATPGVTAGARTYITHDIAFVGSSLVVRDGHLRVPSLLLAENRDATIASMQRLASHSFVWLAGATIAATNHGRAMYDAWRDAIPNEQRVSMP